MLSSTRATLVWRDWMLNRRALVPAIVVFALFQAAFLQIPWKVPQIWLAVSCLWICGLALVPFGHDEKHRAVAWACTLPVSRADLVAGRFAGMWAFVGAALLVAIALAVVVPGSTLPLSFVFAPDALLLAASLATLMLAPLFPFLMRFGLRGLAVLLIPFNVVLPIIFVISKATGSQDEVEGAAIGAVKGLARHILWLREDLSTPGFFLAVIAALLLVNWAGHRLALALFRRREL